MCVRLSSLSREEQNGKARRVAQRKRAGLLKNRRAYAAPLALRGLILGTPIVNDSLRVSTDCQRCIIDVRCGIKTTYEDNCRLSTLSALFSLSPKFLCILGAVG